jgi:hypothetical protein
MAIGIQSDERARSDLPLTSEGIEGGNRLKRGKQFYLGLKIATFNLGAGIHCRPARKWMELL